MRSRGSGFVLEARLWKDCIKAETYRGERFVSVIRTYVEEERFVRRSSATKPRQISKSMIIFSLPRMAMRVGAGRIMEPISTVAWRWELREVEGWMARAGPRRHDSMGRDDVIRSFVLGYF